MSKSFSVFLVIILISIILGGVKKGRELSYYSEDILCKFKVPITCGIKKTLHCLGNPKDLDRLRLFDSCGCNLNNYEFEYGYKIYLFDGCNTLQIPMRGYELLLLGMQIDINHCTADDLIAIDGIGEANANKIIYSREKRGRFNRIEDLLEIKGIGKKLLSKFERYLCVDCRK